jgi:hypothetical protein
MVTAGLFENYVNVKYNDPVFSKVGTQRPCASRGPRSPHARQTVAASEALSSAEYLARRVHSEQNGFLMGYIPFTRESFRARRSAPRSGRTRAASARSYGSA